MTTPDPKSTFPHVRILDLARDVQPPPRVLYSTRPRIAHASDAHRYILKGPEPVVVRAEALGYALAALVGLPTPVARWTSEPTTNERLFASREMRQRDIAFVWRGGLVSNGMFWGDMIAFDVWIANEDRNLGNVIAEPNGGPDGETCRLVAIDFEKAHVLREMSFVDLAMRDPKLVWPRDDLGRLIGERLPFPAGMCERIRALGEARIHETVLGLLHDSMRFRNPTALVQHLSDRAERIVALAREVWHDNG